jgi:hypothetical protein
MNEAELLFLTWEAGIYRAIACRADDKHASKLRLLWLDSTKYESYAKARLLNHCHDPTLEEGLRRRVCSQ